MLIVWGTKNTRQNEGWVCCFCPICRGVRAHEVKRLYLVEHVYYASLGSGRPLVDELTCNDCGVVFGVPLNQIRGSAYRDSPPAPDNSGAYAWPLEQLQARMELERKALSSGGATVEERRKLIAEPIEHIGYEHSQRMQRGPWVSVMAVCVVLLCGCVFAGAVLWSEYRSNLHPSAMLTSWTYGVTAFASLLLAFCVWSYAMLPRLCSGRSRRLIARSLAPLRPAYSEIEGALQSLPRGRTSPARAVRANDFA